MNFYKSSLWSGLYSTINLITGLVITKISAQIIGPVGTAYIGKFANISGLLFILSTASISIGIVKYVSEYKNDPVQLKKLINTSFGIITYGSMLGMLILFSSYHWLNHFAFNGEDFTHIFLLYALFLFIISSQILVTGILNGLGQIKTLSIVNSCAALLNLLFTSYFIYTFHLSGALFSNALYGIFVSLTGAVFLHRQQLFNTGYFKPVIDKEMAGKLIKYGMFAAITSSSWMCTMYIIREHVEGKLSTRDSGLWQAMFSLSDRYLAVITNMLIVYFIPRLSEIQETQELVKEMRKAFMRIIPAMVVVCTGIWLCKDLIIDVLLAETFRPMRALFGVQMIGDFFKVCAMILAYLIASKAMFRSGLKADLLFHASLLGLSIILVNKYGLIGASYAYALATFLYFLVNMYIFKDLVVLIKKSVLPKPWI